MDWLQKETEYLQKIKSLEQKLMNASSNSNGIRARGESASCPKCRQVEEDFAAKFQNYEEELQVLENILYESKNETKKYQQKLEDRTRKCRFYEEMAGQLKNYKDCLQFAVDRLLVLNKSLGDERLPLKSSDYVEPYGFRTIFEELLKEIQENMYFKPEMRR